MSIKTIKRAANEIFIESNLVFLFITLQIMKLHTKTLQQIINTLIKNLKQFLKC